MRILVTGGTGYIGSHAVLQLLGSGYDVTVVDSLVNSHLPVVDRLRALSGRDFEFECFDLRDRHRLEALLAREAVDAVIHFAGLKAVSESVAAPIDYYDNNLGATTSLLGAMDKFDIRTLVFSSSATVYGADAASPIGEPEATSATNPYGWTKVMIEQILRDVAVTDPRWRIAILRYFNPVGAHSSGLIGEDPRGIPNNLVPFVARVAAGALPCVRVYGADYDTPDGTGLRDYIHVEDLVAGHLAALEALTAGSWNVREWNLGTGTPTSVLDMVHAFAAAAGRDIPYRIAGRRPGDIAVCYADPSRALDELGWKASRTIADMCADTWRWQSANPNGYDG